MLILSGDQLYRMDFRRIIEQHIRTGADLTIASLPVRKQEAHGLGILQIDDTLKVTRFVEKPKDPALQDSLMLKHEDYPKLGIVGEDDFLLASMGIYVFNRQVLLELLNKSSDTDFGKHIIPGAISTYQVYSHVFQGYWEDIGTIRNFFESNLDCCSELPRFNFFDMNAPIYTRPRFLPSSKINGASIDHAIIADGCIINRAAIAYSIIGLRGKIGSGSYLHRTVYMGSDYYESAESIAANEAAGRPRIGVGLNTRIENCIIDKNARIGDNVVISPAGKPDNLDHPMYYIRDGIVIVPKNGIIPHNTII
jgi:glucose-1-phosphate adenylyltransferase